MIDRTPLPPAVKGEKDTLSHAVAAEISQLNGARPLAFTFQLVGAWAVIVGIVLWATYVDAIWATVIAIIVVATRHNVLGLLVHEQAHLLGYKRKYGDLLVNLFAAYPLLILTVEGYAQVHLAHHRDYFSETDPDFLRKRGVEWSFPKTPRQTANLFLADILGINTLKLARGKTQSPQGFAFVRRYRVPAWVRPVYFVVLAGVLTWTEAWGIFLLYWVLPILTVSQLIVRWGAICEHKYNLPGGSVAESTPLILLGWWERLLLPNLNFAMHPYHHFFPGVSFSRLPKVHEIYCREGLINHENIFLGYAAYLKFITRRRDHPSGASVDAADSAQATRRDVQAERR
jgi:fatty acid desaturase